MDRPKLLKPKGHMFTENLPPWLKLNDDLIAEGPKVAFRATISATHGGEIFDVAPTHRKLTWGAMGIVRVDAAKMAEFWWMSDLFTLMDQRGLVSE